MKGLDGRITNSPPPPEKHKGTSSTKVERQGGETERYAAARPHKPQLLLGVTTWTASQWQARNGDLAACHHTLRKGVPAPVQNKSENEPVIDQLWKWLSMKKNAQFLRQCMTIPGSGYPHHRVAAPRRIFER
ncbi:hypothetical protein AJ78_04112 [Emergomyces pasteurianus Ep9510]|uniref:Uncharacterized protein n=1 Tax=Emergomyces pasteurianus Ep9510 TaxID=1447872 RepID=A0A1J9Q600_9EURO|nr:hypothetical protein AJ78_04112 [Emergomyces pasteurianus Ep9510]